ncbi:MAG: molybdate ABC transporter substrate-binding protein [Gammaproteobacteria bacterium]|nr:molybdate ABC transporter substrate-binding protein [Gammaproteobacteria bacterium]
MFVLTAGNASFATAETVHVAVAANFTAVMQEIVTQFEQATGHKAMVSFGSTGKLYAQIQHGAPFGLFLAADAQHAERLEREGLVVADSRFTYAIGKLLLWSPDPDLIDAEGRVLSSDRVTRLAIANPKSAPYGTAAQQALTQLGLWDAMQGRLIQGDSISQTYQYVASGNVPLGLIALAQVALLPAASAGSQWLVPAALYAPLRQQVVLLKSAQKNSAAQALHQWLQGEAARTLILRYGYALESQIAR